MIWIIVYFVLATIFGALSMFLLGMSPYDVKYKGEREGYAGAVIACCVFWPIALCVGLTHQFTQLFYDTFEDKEKDG